MMKQDPSALLSANLPELLTLWKRWSPPNVTNTSNPFHSLFDRICIIISFCFGDSLKMFPLLLQFNYDLFFSTEEMTLIKQSEEPVKHLILKGLNLVIANSFDKATPKLTHQEIDQLKKRAMLCLSELSINSEALISCWTKKALLSSSNISHRERECLAGTLSSFLQNRNAAGCTAVVDEMITCLSHVEVAQSINCEVAVRLVRTLD